MITWHVLQQHTPHCSSQASSHQAGAHIILGSKKTTGSGSRMAASSRPLASLGRLGMTTLIPGTWQKKASGLWLW